MSVPADIIRGARLFNAGEYFEAHEAWEDHWGHGPPAEREATLGLIKAAVALHHLAQDNAAGFEWQALQGVPHLRAHDTVWPGMGLGELAEALDSLVAQWRFHGRLPASAGMPRLHLPDTPTSPQ